MKIQYASDLHLEMSANRRFSSHKTRLISDAYISDAYC